MLNPFNQYDGDENRLTHALAITLERSEEFRNAFIAKCDSKKPLGKNIRVEIQVVMTSQDALLETAIPDLLIVDAEGRKGMVFEVKVGAGLDLLQLQRHEARAKEYGVEIVGLYAITGRSGDAAKISEWKKGSINSNWHHIAWTEIYKLSNELKGKNEWAKDLADYLGIVATKMGDENMDSKVKLTTFTGIPFKNARVKRPGDLPHLYEPHQAKRHLLALMDNLEQDEQLLESLGFEKGQAPRRRMGIEASDAVWDYLSNQGKDGHHTKSHHFTVGIAMEHATAMLTIPNASDEFRQLRRYAKNNDLAAFELIINNFLSAVRKFNLNKPGFQPCIIMKQRRYRTIREVYAVDGDLNFDLRTLVGSPASEKVPAIHAQPEWTAFCYQLLRDKNSNIQFQIGLRFIYGLAKGLDEPQAVKLFKDALIATAVFLKEIY